EEESLYLVRDSHPPVPSLGCEQEMSLPEEDAGVHQKGNTTEAAFYEGEGFGPIERDALSVDRESSRPEGAAWLLKHIQPRIAKEQRRTFST
ncbi:MAG: hypothetical protein JW902_10180, partial [Syntrophaceae bacterium]|nr:hypothetical protein [Syntrophaceae bacterium]